MSTLSRLARVTAVIPTTGRRQRSRALWGSAARSAGFAPSARRALRALVVLGSSAAAMLALAVPAASAAVTHNYEFSFDGSDAPGGPFGSPSPPAFDRASDQVYVLDQYKAVDKFNADGTYAGVQLTGASTPAGSFGFQSLSGVAVDNSGGATAGDVYVADTNHHVLDRFSSSGAYQCQITGSASPSASECNGPSGSQTPAGSLFPAGVAVDASGDVYVAHEDHDVVDVFGPAGNYVREIADPHITSPGSIALDASGNLYVTNGSSNVGKFDSTGAFVAALDGGASPQSVAVDPATNHVYVGEVGDVAEFDSSGNLLGRFGSQQLAPQGSSGAYVTGVAVRPSTGEVYAAEFGVSPVRVFSGDIILPDAATGQATGLQPSSTTTGGAATLNGTVSPGGVQVTDCHFEYGTTTAYGQSAPCVPGAGSIPPDSAAHGVSADLTGLAPGLYHVRLVAANANGSTPGPDQTFFITGQPAIDAAVAVDVTRSGALFEARTDPDGFDTQVHFEYGTTTGYGGATASTDIGAGTSSQTLASSATGLAPATTYHFRAVATNAQGTVTSADQTFTTESASCPNDQFRTGSSANLPDCRAYEQVTPADKDSNAPNAFVISMWGNQAASDGNRMAWTSYDALPGSQSDGSFYLSARGASGWSFQPQIPPQSSEHGPALCGLAGAVVFAYSPDLSSHVLGDGAGQDTNSNTRGCGADDPQLVPGEPQGEQNLFLAGAGGGYQLLSPNPLAGSPHNAVFCASTPDLSHVVFASYAQLTPDAPANGSNLYDWSAGGLHLVNVLPDGTPTTTAPLSACDALGDVNANGTKLWLHAISADGSRIFFVAGGNLYVREHDTTTVQVDRPAPGAPGPGGGGSFQFASADGSQVFFTDGAGAGLTADTVPGSLTNLYRYDLASGRLTDLTPAAHADVGLDIPGGVVGASDDGSYVYFVAGGALAAGATAGQPNLYLNHAGSTALVATLDGTKDTGGRPFDQGDWWSGCIESACPNARVSPDGRYLAFDSDKSLTGYDNAVRGGGSCGNDTNANEYPLGSQCEEAYLYDATAQRLVCASCNPTGAPPTVPWPSGFGGAGAATAGPGSPITGPTVANKWGPLLQLGESEGPVRALPRNLTVAPDGTVRLFFQTPDALLPQATNGKVGVYEFELQGTGGCRTSPGCLSLISTGTGSSDATFLDASQTGDDVFFLSDQRLAPTDIDTSFDVYDARVGGGFPYTPPAAPCSGDACKGPTSGAPAPPLAASVTFSGPGNATTTASAGNVRVLSRVVHGSAFIVKVSVPSAGRVTVTGAQINAVRRFFAHAGTYRLKLHLTSAAVSRLRHTRGLKTTVHVDFGAASGTPAVSATVRLTVEPPLRQNTRHARRATNSNQGGAR